MTVQDLINPPVTTCTIKTDVEGVRRLLTIKKVSAIPVVELKDEQILLRGIVSYADIAGVYDDNVNVQQIMTTEVTVVEPSTSIKEAAQIMIDKKIHHLVVVDNDKIIGIVSSLDYVKVVAES